MEIVTEINTLINEIVWGLPAMVCIVGVGIYLTIGTGFIQVRKFPYAIAQTVGRFFDRKEAGKGSISPFQAVCTALAGTIGTGSIAGVAGAIAIGGLCFTGQGVQTGSLWAVLCTTYATDFRTGGYGWRICILHLVYWRLREQAMQHR